jgi:hypothetical protein
VRLDVFDHDRLGDDFALVLSQAAAAELTALAALFGTAVAVGAVALTSIRRRIKNKASGAP